MSEQEERAANSAERHHQMRFVWSLILVGSFFGFCAIFLQSLRMEAMIAGLVSLTAVSLAAKRDQPKKAGLVARRKKRKPIPGQRELLETLQFPAFLLDREGCVQYCNACASDAFGDIATGDKLTVRFRQPEFRANLLQALEKEDCSKFEYNESVPNDRRFQVSLAPVNETAITNRSGARTFLLIFNDHTEARRTDQMRSDFIANASHELRTPLASILGFLETIRGSAKDDPEAIERFTAVMLDQAERMTRLLNDLLSLSQIETRPIISNSERVTLEEILNSVTNAMEQTASELGVKLELDIEQDFCVVGERDSLIQVFENLVENACKYGQEGKRVQICVKSLPVVNGTTPQVRVSIRDFGPGIALEHQPRITERFYRVDVARSREKQGTGLGLAIVKNILQRHNTRLKLVSKPGEGAEFLVDFLVANVEE